MTTIAIANQKGGVGKTAIAVNLAHGLIRETHCKMLVVDADPAGSVFKHFRRRTSGDPPYNITGYAQADLHRHLPNLIAAGAYDTCIIDCPAGSSNITRSALIAADIVLVPVQPSFCDFDSAEELMPLLRDVTELKPGLQVLVVISRKKAGSNNYSRDARSAAMQFFVMDGVNVTVLEQAITDRKDITVAYTEGVTVYELRGSSAARVEFDQLSEEVAALCLRAVAA